MKHEKRITLIYLKGLCSGKYTYRQASESTGYSIRHLEELKKKYLLEGSKCLESKRKGLTPNNKVKPEIRKKIVNLYLTEYDGYTFLFFSELLREEHNINYSYQTIYNILTENKIKSPERRKAKKDKNHRTRPRRANEGDLMQIDGTPYPWFKWCGDNTKYCIQAGVDDATSKMVAMYMTENECLYGYMEMLRICDRRGGLPREIYSDRAGIFISSQKTRQPTIEEQLQGITRHQTQWQRILKELHVRQILANSPQAKGRVERMWNTLQKRLPHYFRKYRIKTIKEANIFLETKFIDIYNKRFAKEPFSNENFYIKYQGNNLNDVLQAKFPIKTNHNGEFKFHSYTFGVMECRNSGFKKGELCISERGVFVLINGAYYPVKPLDFITDGRAEYMPKVVKNILYEFLYRDMKEESA